MKSNKLNLQCSIANIMIYPFLCYVVIYLNAPTYWIFLTYILSATVIYYSIKEIEKEGVRKENELIQQSILSNKV